MQSNDLESKSMDWLMFNRDLRLERINDDVADRCMKRSSDSWSRKTFAKILTIFNKSIGI